MILRSDYMNKKFTHDEYYGQFVTKNIVDYVGCVIGEERIKRSMHPHFSDIPLEDWNKLHSSILIYCERKLRKVNGQAALCDTVCIAKRAAKEIRGF